jgi:drug/metabolite transporter (DMT)-like permease
MAILIALTLPGEPFRPLLVVGTVLIVLGGVVLAGERTRPEHYRMRGAALALLCAALFAARDNIVRWTARDQHPPPLAAATTSLLAAAALILVYLLLVRRDRLRTCLPRALPAFAPAGVALALGYDTLLMAFDHGGVSVVWPLNATGSVWASLLAALVIGRSESIGRRTALAAFLIVVGGGLIGALRWLGGAARRQSIGDAGRSVDDRLVREMRTLRAALRAHTPGACRAAGSRRRRRARFRRRHLPTRP